MSRRRLMPRILGARGLRAVFQPIVDIQRLGLPVAALECLVRGPEGTPVEDPRAMSRYVRSRHAEVPADRACLAEALRAARGLRRDVDLGVNVHAATLGRDHEFLALLADTAEAQGLGVEQIIVEVGGLSSHSGPALTNNLEGLKRIGMRIALDDVGSSGDCLRSLIDLRPDFLKLDPHFTEGARLDGRRQSVLEQLSDLASRLGAQVVADGVRHPDDLDALRVAGVHLAQGPLLREPVEPARLAELGLAAF